MEDIINANTVKKFENTDLFKKIHNTPINIKIHNYLAFIYFYTSIQILEDMVSCLSYFSMCLLKKKINSYVVQCFSLRKDVQQALTFAVWQNLYFVLILFLFL